MPTDKKLNRSTFETLRREKTVSDYIPYSSCVAPGIVLCRNGDLVTTFRAQGIPFETVEDDLIDAAFRQFNVFLRAISDSRVAIVVHRIRRPVQDRLDGDFGSDFAQNLADKYNERIGHEKLMATELYISIVWRAPMRIASLFGKRYRTAEEVKADLAAAIDKLENLSGTMQTSLSRYDLTRLSTYVSIRSRPRQATDSTHKAEEKSEIWFSEQLSFYNFLLTGTWQEIRVPEAPLYNVIGNVQVFSGTNMLQIETINGVRYCQSVELKDYNGTTFSGILDGLLYPDVTGLQSYSFVETQSFAFLSKPDGKSFLTQQKKQLTAAQDVAVSQLAAMDDALDGLENGDFSMGEYAYSLIVFGNTPDEARTNTLDAAKKLQDEGFLPFISTLALEGAYFSQLPCNWQYRPRRARITSANFAGLSPLHNFPDGKRDGNPWGEALALLKTPSDQPYYFNLHTSPLSENSFDKKTLGNTVVIGQSGSGKTVLLNFVLAMLQKYRNKNGFSTVYFDKDRGAEIAIRAMGGGYLAIETGRPTGFNPFAALDATEENIQFLIRLLKLLLEQDGRAISTSEDLSITQAVRTVMSMPRDMRRIGLIRQNITEGTTKEERENSIVRRLARWCGNGDLAWVFDNPKDDLDFNRHVNFGIDGTEFLDNKQIRTPIAFYLLYRMEQVIDGRRFVFVMDEFWKWLLDDAFSGFAFDKLKTIRKQNGLGIFATQSPSDVLSSDIAKAVIEQSATQIFLPNPKADRADYVDGFKLTEIEYEIVRNLAEDSRRMLIKQGHRSVVCKLDLSDFEDELLVLSGSTDNIARLDSIRQAVGDDPKDWLPHFFEANRRKVEPFNFSSDQE